MNLDELLPAHIRRRDAEAGGVLAALLAVIGEQAGLIADDIDALYDDWFVETCADWVVPYLGDLVGNPSAGRAAVAATVAARRRKGTLPLLEEIAAAVGGWPARAVESAATLAVSQPVRRYADEERAAGRRAATAAARFPDLRRGAELDLAGGPFDPLAHRAPRPAVTVTVWRLKAHRITEAPAYCVDRARNLYTFSLLGNDTQLVTRPEAVRDPGPDDVPAPIRRRAAKDRLGDFYGAGRSFAIWRGDPAGRGAEPVPPDQIVIADLSGWAYRPRRDQIAVDPVRGRIAFGPRAAPRRGVWVTYHHGAADDLGGGEYPRAPHTPRAAELYRVGPGERFDRITQAYEAWRADNGDGSVPRAVIELTSSAAFQEQLEFVVRAGEHLTVRAADGARPVLRLLDWYSNRPDALQIRAEECGADDERPVVVLDGLLVTGRGVSVTGPVGALALRHCTLVPGWSLEPDCGPAHPEEPSLVLEETPACVRIERSVLGTVLVIGDEVRTDPITIDVADSILDATAPDLAAVSAPDCGLAHATLTLRRTTVLGEIHTHAIELGQDSIFQGLVRVARRGLGCLRFSAVHPGGRTPRRYECTGTRPAFSSVRYGMPGYAQLRLDGPDDLARGAEDRSELGVHHDLHQPQRLDALRLAIAEHTPATADVALVIL